MQMMFVIDNMDEDPSEKKAIIDRSKRAFARNVSLFVLNEMSNDSRAVFVREMGDIYEDWLLRHPDFYARVRSFMQEKYTVAEEKEFYKEIMIAFIKGGILGNRFDQELFELR